MPGTSGAKTRFALLPGHDDRVELRRNRGKRPMMSKSSFDAEFDVVVVGAGSAGCVLSARLTENPDITLCAIEAGGRDRNPWIHIPLGFGKVVPNPNVNWGYQTEPEPGLGGRSIVWPRGKVLGGSGSINGMVFLRGAPSDYDGWQALGAEGWSYKDVLPYFKRMEHCVDGADEWRATGGPMTVSNIKRPSAVARAFVEACERLQYQRNPDFNGERIDGIGFAPLNVHNGWRRSTAVGYLKPNLNRRNLELMTKTHVRRILFEGRRAVGVEVERDGQVQRIGARRELILSGGAINSPVLLLASGIGPAGELAAQGIDVKLDLAGVGKNLQDHYQSSFAFKTNSPGTLNEAMLSPTKAAKLALQWLFTGTGQMAVGATEATLFAKSRPSEPVPDIQYQALNYSSDGIVKGLHRWPGFSFIFSVCRPKSRGEITLRDSEGRLPPRILANYLTDPDDVRIMVAAFRIARQIAATEPFRSLISEPLRPGPDVQSDAQIEDYVRKFGSTVFHPCSTCRMGEDDRAVVDSQLRVRGIDGLRVADASVMPAMPSPNIHPATIMVAEKGSDIIAKALAS
jgi:choline dehydrogenase